MNKVLMVLVAVLLTIASTGCNSRERTVEFPFSVSNRTLHTILVYGDGKELGEIEAGRPGAFTLWVEFSGESPNGPTPTTQVTLAARDLVTGLLSKEKRLTLTEGQPRNVEFLASDFR